MIQKILASIVVASTLIAASFFTHGALEGKNEINVSLTARCGDIRHMIDKARKRYGEEMVFISTFDPGPNDKNDRQQTVMLWNKVSKTYTIFQIMTVTHGISKEKDSLACIISTGVTELDFRVLMDFGV